jgi:hypothetical protein
VRPLDYWVGQELRADLRNVLIGQIASEKVEIGPRHALYTVHAKRLDIAQQAII